MRYLSIRDTLRWCTAQHVGSVFERGGRQNAGIGLRVCTWEREGGGGWVKVRERVED